MNAQLTFSWSAFRLGGLMIVGNFLQWAQTAPPSARADRARALARAYLERAFDAGQKAEAEQALTAMLDDPSPRVRRALAESFAKSPAAPRHIILGLADEPSHISAIVLRHSPLLTEGELIDCAAVGDAFAQSAIALRAHLSAPVAAALAEVGRGDALILLALNLGADLPEFSMRRMIERHGQNGQLREALLARPHLSAGLRAELAAAAASVLFGFVAACGWLPAGRSERAEREAREKANVIIGFSSEAEAGGPGQFVAYLRQSGQLTAGLVLRALLSCNISLFEAALCELSGLPPARVQGLLAEWSSVGFAALYRKAGLPPSLLPAFRAALEAWHVCPHDVSSSARLSRQMVEHVLRACEALPRFDGQLLRVLRRFEAEAAREDARAVVALEEPVFRLGDEDKITPVQARPVEPAPLAIDFAALEAALSDHVPEARSEVQPNRDESLALEEQAEPKQRSLPQTMYEAEPLAALAA